MPFFLHYYSFSLRLLNHLVREFIHAQADHLADSILAHRHAVQHIRQLDRVAVVGDHDELRRLA